MVEQATKEEVIPLDAHCGESGDKKGSQGGKPFKNKNPKVVTRTRKLRVFQSY